MKFRNTFILVLLLAGVFGYLYFVEQHQQTSNEATENSRRIIKFDRDKANAITIKTPESKIEMTKKDDTWFLEAPVKDRADTMAISQLFTSLELLKYDAIVESGGKGADKDQMKDFGLSNSDTRIRVTGADKPVELLFGKESAVEGKSYVKIDGSSAVYVISNDLKNQLSKKPDEFRDKKLTNLAVGKVSRAVLKTAAGEIEVEKKEGHWSLVRPLKTRADDARIGDLISQAVTARIETFLADGANAAAYGLEQPRGSLSIYSEGKEEPVVLNIGASLKEDPDKEGTYAKLSSRESVVMLPKSIETLLETKPNDLRDKSLLRFEEDIVDRIAIVPAGKSALMLARDKEKWVRKAEVDQLIDSGSATRMLQNLKGATISNFVADVATELPRYGLDNPALKVTLSSYSSENTAETKAGERPIVTVLFGNVEGAEVYAKLDDEPFVVAVPANVLSSVITDPLQLQDLLIYPFKPEEVTSLEIAREGEPMLSFERETGKSWKLVKGDGAVNQVAAQSLVNTLAGLRAVRWIGETASDHGFDKPTASIGFKLGATGRKLILGAATGDEMWNATAEGKTGTFLVSRPDAEALRASLLEKSPSASGPPAGTNGSGAPAKTAPANPASSVPKTISIPETKPAGPVDSATPTEAPAFPAPPPL